MGKHECRGCSEYLSLSRRQFMAMTGGSALAAGLMASLPRVALATDECSGRDVIVTIFLRGGADGLTICPPHGENAYYAARPTLAVPRPDSGSPDRCINLDGFFGMTPAMASLLPAYQAGHLLFIHACGSPDAGRSHFDSQRYIEVGKPGDITLFDGWLAKHLLSTAPATPNSLLRAIGIGNQMILSLQGAPLALPISDIGHYGLLAYPGYTAERLAVLSDLYAAYSDPLRSAAATTLSTINLLSQINLDQYTPAGGADYSNPLQGFSYALKSTAALIKADLGVEAVAIDLDGWDTHGTQQPFVGGYLYGLMEALGMGLAAFHADVIAGSNRNVTVIVMTEFGRRLDENGSGGTDHGHGEAMMLMGRNIAGGRVLSQWPGLAPEQLFQGIDLAVTIDWRDILAEVVSKRLSNAANLPLIFPDYTPTFRGVTRGCGGDTNCDGQVNLADVAAFNQALLDPAGYQAAHPGCSLNSADVNADGVVDGRDVAAFTKKLVGP